MYRARVRRRSRFWNSSVMPAGQQHSIEGLEWLGGTTGSEACFLSDKMMPAGQQQKGSTRFPGLCSFAALLASVEASAVTLVYLPVLSMYGF